MVKVNLTAGGGFLQAAKKPYNWLTEDPAVPVSPAPSQYRYSALHFDFGTEYIKQIKHHEKTLIKCILPTKVIPLDRKK